MTGPTGSGKTTTLAAMIDSINSEIDRHIITIEDPIEYYHKHKKSHRQQREVGVDVAQLRRGPAPRAAPGPGRDPGRRNARPGDDPAGDHRRRNGPPGVRHAAHDGAARTINRIIDAFPIDQQEQIRAQLSTALIAVISQVLLPQRRQARGVVAAFEIMIITDAIAHNIRKNETHKITSSIQTGSNVGMILLDDFLYNLFLQKKITYQTMMGSAQNPADLESEGQGVHLRPAAGQEVAAPSLVLKQ